ncbi:MAG: DUF1566 domain-containing protein, partial [Terracidiphilus sp.]
MILNSLNKTGAIALPGLEWKNGCATKSFEKKNERMKQCPQCDTGYPDSLDACPTNSVQLSKMRKGRIPCWILALVIGVAILPALSQQDEGPILRPRKPLAKPAGATLLVTCDLTCNWKLDGVAKGRMDAGGSAKVNVGLGQHIVIAMTEEGLDKVENEINIKTAGQTIVHLTLQPVRDARLNAEQEALDKAGRDARERTEQEARDKAVRVQREKEERERKRVSQEEAAGVWTDPSTGLIWAKEDNGRLVNWQQAMDYCGGLKMYGYTDWRLPTIDEFKGIFDPKLSYDPNVNPNGYHLKGNIEEGAKSEWSSSQANYPEEKWLFYSYSGNHRAERVDDTNNYALCVRGPGEQEAREKAEREVREKAALVAQIPLDRAAREDAEGIWTDPATGLTWMKTDNGKEVTWERATAFCRNLRLAGHTDWRLATIDELHSIYEPNVIVLGILSRNTSSQGLHVKGNLEMHFGWEWTSSPGDASGEAWSYNFSKEPLKNAEFKERAVSILSRGHEIGAFSYVGQ